MTTLKKRTINDFKRCRHELPEIRNIPPKNQSTHQLLTYIQYIKWLNSFILLALQHKPNRYE